MPRLLVAVTSTTTDTPFKGVDDFFGSSLFSAIVRLLAIFAIALWLALVFWTAKDARRRIDDPWIVAVCIAAAVLFGPVAVVIYLILRPPEYLDDVRERELEIRAMERRLGAEQVCPYCRNPVDPSFLSCPYCATKLKNACRRCKSPLDPAWRLCPYCETSVGGLPAPATTRPSRTEPTRTEA